MTSTLGGKGIAALLRLVRCGKCTGNQGGKEEDGGVSEREEERKFSSEHSSHPGGR